MYAVNHDDDASNYKIIKFLIRNGASVHRINNNGKTAISMVRMYNEEFCTFNLLIKSGSIINYDVFLSACASNNVGLVQHIIKNYAEIISQGSSSKNIYQNTPLTTACESENYKIVELLLKNKFNVNEKSSENGDTPLIIACIKNNKKLVSLLLNYNADKEIQNDDEDTALAIAGKQNNSDIAKILVLSNNFYCTAKICSICRATSTVNLKLFLKERCIICYEHVDHLVAFECGHINSCIPCFPSIREP
jgi:ankyrin repeat protein